jgi:isopenicillin N synthase-like dioxygenase
VTPMAHSGAIPVIDIGALFGPNSPARAATDAEIHRAANETGFLSITGLPPDVPVGPAARRELLRIFRLEPAQHRPLWRRKFAPRNPNVYRGWFALQPGNLTSKEGIDIGPDVPYGPTLLDPGDPLCEQTPMPDETLLPGWRAAVRAYYLAMVGVSRALLRSIARSLELEECFFDAAFQHGLSTLRLIRYPVRTSEELESCKDPALWVVHDGKRLHLVGAPHTDSGFVTLLAQDGVPGLQARTSEGGWLDVPPQENSLAVNFGQVLERWCGGRIKATEHRVLGAGQERYSIPFFYEARANAEIRPLPLDDPRRFEPFLYGDFLWERMVNFVEFRGMAAERKPRGARRATLGA